MSYIQHQQFIQDICNALSEFMNDILHPSEAIVQFKTPIKFDIYTFCLCYLTTTPNTFQQVDTQYGQSVLQTERANPANLPRLNRPEVSILTYFGIQNALTLHPYSTITNTYIPIITLDQYGILPQEHQLKTIATLFLMALKKSPLQKPIPILTFGASESLQVSALGFCGGHRYCGIINGGGNRSSIGFAENANLQDVLVQQQKAQTILGQSETVGAFPIPLISRYYEATTRDLYSKGSDQLDYVVNGESQAKIKNQSLDRQFCLADINTIIKQYKPQYNVKQLQYLHSDRHFNVFLNCYNMPNNNIANQSPAMSRYIRSSPSLLYGPLYCSSQFMQLNVSRCWDVFNHLPKQAKARGVAVESLVLHMFADNFMTQPVFMAIQTKLINKYVEISQKFGVQSLLPLLQISDNQQSKFQAQRAKDFSIMFELLKNNGNKILLSPYCLPTSNMLRTLMISIHFGTAAIGSFVDDSIDIDEAMVWAFNMLIGQAQPTVLMKQLGEKIENIGKSAPFLYNYNQQLYDEINQYVFSDISKQTTELANYENGLNHCYYKLYYHSNRFCKYNCFLCRIGDVINSLISFSDAINYIKFFFQSLPKYFNDAEKPLLLLPIDVMKDSLIYQKYYQTIAYVNAKDSQIFIPYIVSTYDQVMRLYEDVETYSPKSILQIENSKLYLALEFYFLEFLAFNVESIDSLPFLASFMLFLESKNISQNCNTVQFAGKKDLNIDYIADQIQDIISGKPLIYPYCNRIVYFLIIHLLQQYQLIKPFNVEQRKQSNQDKILKGFDIIVQVNQKFLTEVVDSQYVYALALFAKLHNVYSAITEVEIELDNEQPLSCLLAKGQLQIPETINTYIVQLISPEAEYKCYLHEQLLKVSVFNRQLILNQLNYISIIEQKISSIYLIMELFNINYNEAKSMVQGFSILEGEERVRVYKLFDKIWQPISWELVLNSLQPGHINHLPHRFYFQFLGAKVENNYFIPQFQNLISSTIVETIPYGVFQQK